MSGNRPRRRRRRNRGVPAYAMSGNRHRRRRRNPLAVPGLVKSALYAIGGGIGTRVIPQMVLKEQNIGLTGYLANAVTTLGLSAAASRFISKDAGQAVVLGGAVMITGRIVEDFVGQRLVEFGAIPGFAGMGRYGDMSYDLSGEFINQGFPVPISSLGPASKAALPPMAAEAAAAENQAAQNAQAAMGGPWGSPWAM